MKKKIVLLLLATVFLFTGCANVKYTVVDSGTYLQQNIQVSLDKAKLDEANCPIEEVKKSIVNCVNSLHDAQYNSFLSNLQMLVVNESLTPNQCEEILNAIKVSRVWPTDEIYMYEILFTGVSSADLRLSYTEVFYLYNYGTTIPPSSDDESEGNVITFEWLTTKVESTQTTAFANSDSIANYFMALFAGYGFTEEDVSYTYTYGTNYHRLHSDADTIENVNGIYMHTWDLENKDEKITLYRLIADTTGWYIIALVVGVVTAGIVAIIAYTKKSKSKKAINAELSYITNTENKN